MSMRLKFVAVGSLCLVAVAGVFGDAFGQRKELVKAQEGVQEEKKDNGKPAARKLDEIYYGVSSCANKGCHGGDPPKEWVKNPKTKKQYDLLVRCDEAATWQKQDKHADAYNVLVREGGLGRRMEKILARTPRGEEIARKTDRPYRVSDDPACLACHAVVIKDQKLAEDSFAVGFDIKEGVSCVACHGNRGDWVAQHSIAVTAYKFRPLPRKQKQEHYGMRDLSSPLTQAELCVSCHVGSHKEGKFVTHEMYAAGHPPLPGFEAATFADQEPRHWQLKRDKKESIQEELGFKKGTQEETHLMLVGGVVAFRDTMTLLAEQSKAANAASRAEDKMLDLSNYDCWACHHDLKKRAWRPQPPRGGKAGKIPMRDWSAELVRLSVKYVGMKDEEAGKKLDGELTEGLKKLTAAFQVGVGGDVKRIETESRALAKWSDGLADRLNKTAPTAEDARKLLPLIPEVYGKQSLGYDSARQVSWAADTLFREGYRDTSGSADARKALAEIGKTLRLRFPEGRKLIEDGLKEGLDTINDYDEPKFKKWLEGFGTALKAKGE